MAEAVEAAVEASREMLGVAVTTMADRQIDLSLTEYRTMVILQVKGPRSLSDIAIDLHLSNATAGRAAAKLERKGLAGRHADRYDGRVVVVSLTEEGRALYDETMARRQALFEIVLRDLSPDELVCIARAFRGFAESSWELRMQI